MVLTNNFYSDFIQKTKNNILINKCLLIICNNNEFIDICYNIIENIGNSNVYCVRPNDNEYKQFLNKKIIIFVDNPEKYLDVIKKINNREMILFRKSGELRITQINPECNVIIFSDKLNNIKEEIKNMSLILDYRKNENNITI